MFWRQQESTSNSKKTLLVTGRKVPSDIYMWTVARHLTTENLVAVLSGGVQLFQLMVFLMFPIVILSMAAIRLIHFLRI